jgi:DinB superfamily
MNVREAIKTAYEMPDQICRNYLADLTDADLLVRPVPNSNHIAWQLGHLIASEHRCADALSPGKVPPLPSGFAEKHTKETSKSDDPNTFCSKDEYLKLYDQVRAATLKTIDGLNEGDLDKPAPENLRKFVPTVASVVLMQPSHWLMHAGQWAIVRRKLGKPPLF